jgi:hypothetical protein
MAWGCLDGGGMLIDRNSGEFIPADQVIRDPLHIDKLDFFQEDHLGPLKATMANGDEEESGETMEDEGGDVAVYNTSNILTFAHDGEHDLHMLHEEQSEDDVDLYVPHSSQKARWAEFRSRKKGRK